MPLFVRRLVGLDRNAAKVAFGRRLDGVGFTASQVRFVEVLLNYLTRNGVMDPGLLYEPPFTDVHHEGLDGLFPGEEGDRLVSIVRDLNRTAGATFEQAGG